MGFENCEDYTEKYGYECVPYYQCHNGTIITDGAGLIDIRNGFGSLTPEDSKCPGFLDVCCKDPDFIPPPPPKIKYAPKCGRRNQNGLGVRIQGFTESESQFGEWPHMCAILHEKPIEQEGGYAGEPQTVNLYQCGGSLIAPGVILHLCRRSQWQRHMQRRWRKPPCVPSKYDPNTYIQAGMVAWGIGCGEDGTPGVYASVSK